MNNAAEIGLPIPAEVVAAALNGHDDFRVLRRIRPMRRDGGGMRTGMYVGCALAITTTGPDHDRDDLIELAVQRFWGDTSGRIVTTGPAHAWLEEPHGTVPDEVTNVTGLTDEDVCGHHILDAVATSLIIDADFVVTHDAATVRPFVEARLPFASGAKWVCTSRDVGWAAHGFDGSTLPHLLCEAGWFPDKGTADSAVLALLHLLDHPLPSGGTVLSDAVGRAAHPTWSIDAAGAPFEAGKVLQERGYRWGGSPGSWSREVSPDAWRTEAQWVALEVYGGLGAPEAREVTWQERYAAKRSACWS
jgi:DNA polymerase-3 subunit epsilon